MAYCKVPIELLSIETGSHLFVTAKINGVEARLLIDTGASQTVLDKNRITRFYESEEPEMENNEKKSTGLGTNEMESQLLSIDTLCLGELEIFDYWVPVLDMSHVNASYEQLGIKPLDGVIGGDLLKKYNAALFYRTKTLKLFY